MFLCVKRTLALAVCVGLLAAGWVSKSRKTWRDLPNPFALYPHTHALQASVESAGRSFGLRAVWVPRDRVRTFSLLFGACLCLAVLEMKVLRRTKGRNAHQATALADALRGGALEFDEGPRRPGPIWTGDADDDEPEEPETAQPEMSLSRYDQLAYNAASDDPLKDMRVTISYIGGGADPDAPVRNEDLLLGVPLEFVKPEVKPSKAARPMLALTGGSTDGDDPGESVHQPDVA